MAGSFASYRSYGAIVGTGDLPPVFDHHGALGHAHVKPPVDVMLSRRLEQAFSELGFIPLTWDPVETTLHWSTASSAQLPRSFGQTEGGAAATLNVTVHGRTRSVGPFLTV
jgi:type VI secretion system protein ImpC